MQAAYTGGGLIELPAMLQCEHPMAVLQVRSEARFVTRAKGGSAAVREAIEHILKAQGRWEEVVERYAG